ncbi:MAG: DoxX family membrane protein [Acidobacteria bacterium]|nr:DoxX family membrane protein [Acidobacteriota bacterium]
MGFLRGSAEDRCRPLAGLPPRLFAGYFFLKYGLEKVTDGFDGDLLRTQLAGWMAESRYEFYVPFLEHVVTPFAGVFAFLVMWGEVLIGLMLLLGLAARAAALAGLLLCANFLLATGTPLISDEEPVYFAVMLATVYLTAAGRALGLDFLLRKVLPRWAT